MNTSFVRHLTFILRSFLTHRILNVRRTTLNQTIRIFSRVAQRYTNRRNILLLSRNTNNNINRILSNFTTRSYRFTPTEVLHTRRTMNFQGIITCRIRRRQFSFNMFRRIRLRTIFRISRHMTSIVNNFRRMRRQVPHPALIFRLQRTRLIHSLLRRQRFTLMTTRFILFMARQVNIFNNPQMFRVNTRNHMNRPHATIRLIVFRLHRRARTLNVTFRIRRIITLSFTRYVRPTAPNNLLGPITSHIFTKITRQ